jgi:hypothetical protein
MTTELTARTADTAERGYLIRCGYHYEENLKAWIKCKGKFKAVVSDGTSAIGILFAVELLNTTGESLCDTQSNRNVHSAVAAADMMLAYRISNAGFR